MWLQLSFSKILKIVDLDKYCITVKQSDKFIPLEIGN